MLAGLAAAYGLARLVEAYALWRERRWAEWLAAVSGAIYVPFELYELIHRFSWLAMGALAVNLAVVGVMVGVLRRVSAGTP
jgi:uncharacterized membrane protein (DUF2068 family)